MRRVAIGVIFLSAISVNLHAQYIAGFDDDTINEDESIDMDVLANDINLEGFFDYSIGGIPEFPDHGTATFIEATQTIIYEPDPNYFGTDVYTYLGCVNSGATCANGIAIITILPLPDAPDAINDTAYTFGLTPVNVTVLGNDIDVDVEGIEFEIVSDPTNGVATLVDANTINYSPNAGFYDGVDQLTYKACKIGSDDYCDEAIVTIFVQFDNFNAPSAMPDAAVTDIGTFVTIDVTDNDFDGDADPLVVTDLILGDDMLGTATINVSNMVDYVSDIAGLDSFLYVVCDYNAPSKCDTALVVVTINSGPVTEPIVHVSDSFSPNNDGINDELQVSGLANYANFTLSIYNRWNDLVYETSDMGKQWDGRANSGMLASDSTVPEGTYFYILNLAGEAEPLRGYIVLKR